MAGYGTDGRNEEDERAAQFVNPKGVSVWKKY